jgi:hypothetical protein
VRGGACYPMSPTGPHPPLSQQEQEAQGREFPAPEPAWGPSLPPLRASDGGDAHQGARQRLGHLNDRLDSYPCLEAGARGPVHWA